MNTCFGLAVRSIRGLVRTKMLQSPKVGGKLMDCLKKYTIEVRKKHRESTKCTTSTNFCVERYWFEIQAGNAVIILSLRIFSVFLRVTGLVIVKNRQEPEVTRIYAWLTTRKMSKGNIAYLEFLGRHNLMAEGSGNTTVLLSVGAFTLPTLWPAGTNCVGSLQGEKLGTSL